MRFNPLTAVSGCCRQRDSGSAAAEFVLLVGPLGMLFYALLCFLCGGIVQQATVALASKAAEVCGLADTTPEDVQRLTNSWMPNFMRVQTFTCARQQDWAEVTLKTTFAPPFEFLQSEVAWHAASEN